MFAVIAYKGNQYKVAVGREFKIDLLDSEDKKIKFDQVLLVCDDKKTSVGTPTVKGAFVEADFVKNISDKKVDVVKFHSKKRYKKIGSHRQDYTVIKVTNISF